MLEHHEFCDDCPGCRPRLAKVNGSMVVAVSDDDPMQMAMDDVWDNKTSYEQRHAYIEVTLHESTNAVHLKRGKNVVEMFKEEWRRQGLIT